MAQSKQLAYTARTERRERELVFDKAARKLATESQP